MKHLFIFCFQYNPERYILFQFCIAKLKSQISEHKLNAEIFVHEIGQCKQLSDDFIYAYSDYYVFSYTETTIFNRAWSYNKVIKNFNFKENTNLILIDSDILLTDNWIKNLHTVKTDFMAGWSGVWYLNEAYTHDVMLDKVDINYLQKSDWKNIGIYHTPNIDGSAGGITFITSDLFMKVKGLTEYFKGTWGNEDTACAYKMKHLGYNFIVYPYEIIHLHHNHKTYIDETIKNKWNIIKEWSTEKWIYETNNIDSWGD